ncbi:MAG: hypothetical protein NZO58_01330 [Gemmataceae bacterium]|nr:hypothetical protein [Gemmataceae bacterium]
MAKQVASSEPLRNWHRLFGLLLSEHLHGSPYVVELEKDLSHRQQWLDIVVVRRGEGALSRPMPDGLDRLHDHNLITFKSFRETLDDWALKELTGHYVNYRKQVSGRGRLVPEESFGLYAVCARTPRELFSVVATQAERRGVYVCRRGSDAIRVVVAAELPKTENNALVHLFSAAVDQVQYGATHYQLPSAAISTIVNRLIAEYRRAGLVMPYTMDDFRKEVALEVLDQLTPEERLRGLAPEERLRGLAPEERLRGLTAEQIERYLRTLQKKSSRSTGKKRGRRT